MTGDATPPATDRAQTRLSRRLSYLLRHNPAAAGLTLDPAGWVRIADLVEAVPDLTRNRLLAIVAADTKGRYTIDGDRIRAAQGHSAGIADQAHTQPVEPPPALYHGTTWHALTPILRDGLRPGGRSHVHLSADPQTAAHVGARHGHPVVLLVDAAAAHAAGHVFHRADNGVWLTRELPPTYLTRHPEAGEPR